ncbi:thioredoxin family protein [Pedobacter psychroterrae]|uniref:Thioredoxin family protein n=1 Tax=Pedobacter psychroterrae TaxID=2530453 RepID=A0A4R0NLA1_9SPHI|nr:thioredoxin family protein [Pedobacter psychroterrae]TCD01541.1 thioredoxin family protein [Pedobacter psychroterrae]
MKLLFISFLYLFVPSAIWLGNFDEALKVSRETHKQVLINFSGSDWCGPCIRLRKEILETEAFEKYAGQHLVLVRADFPRQKKNRLSAEQTRLNEALAERYNPDGKFPFTVLTDERGKVIRSWDGFPQERPEEFVQQVAKSATK